MLCVWQYNCGALVSSNESNPKSCQAASVPIQVFSVSYTNPKAAEGGWKNFFFFFKKERLKHDSMLRGMKSPLSLLFTPIISLQSVPNGASGQPAADPCVKVIKTIIIIIKIAV